MADEVKGVVISEKADQTPLTRRIFEAVAPHVPKHPVGLEILGIDVVYGAFNVNGMLVNGYALLITVRGALLGPQYNITNAHVVPPAVPSEVEVHEMIHISTSRLREAKTAQAQTPPQPPGGIRGRSN